MTLFFCKTLSDILYLYTMVYQLVSVEKLTHSKIYTTAVAGAEVYECESLLALLVFLALLLDVLQCTSQLLGRGGHVWQRALHRRQHEGSREP